MTTTDNTWTMQGAEDYDPGRTLRGVPTIDDAPLAVGGAPGFCYEPCPRTPRPSFAMVAWIRIEALATAAMSALGLLRPWYALARLALRLCPPLARLVAPLRPVVLEPSLSGGGEPVPVSGDRVVQRPQCAGGDIHDHDRCTPVGPIGDILQPARVFQRYRRRVVGDAIIDSSRGWHARRWGRA